MIYFLFVVFSCVNYFDSVSGQNLALTRIGNKDYYVHDISRMNWFLADHFCRRNNMQLLTINSQYEYDSIRTYIRSNPAINGSGITNSVWTSGTDYGRLNNWVWMSTGEPVTFFDWSPGSPDHLLGQQHIIELQAASNYQMNDDVYTFENYFFCEKLPERPCGSGESGGCCGGCCSRGCY